MNATIEKKLDSFLFPVGERAVFVDDDKTYKPTKHYKAVVREDNGKLVSIMKDSYQLVHNRINFKFSANIDAACRLIEDKQFRTYK